MRASSWNPKTAVSHHRCSFSSVIVILYYSLHDMVQACWNKPVLVNTFYDKCNISPLIVNDGSKETLRKYLREFYLSKTFSGWYRSLLGKRSAAREWNEEVLSLVEKWDVIFNQQHRDDMSIPFCEHSIHKVMIIRMQLSCRKSHCNHRWKTFDDNNSELLNCCRLIRFSSSLHNPQWE